MLFRSTLSLWAVLQEVHEAHTQPARRQDESLVALLLFSPLLVFCFGVLFIPASILLRLFFSYLFLCMLFLLDCVFPFLT